MGGADKQFPKAELKRADVTYEELARRVVELAALKAVGVEQVRPADS